MGSHLHGQADKHAICWALSSFHDLSQLRYLPHIRTCRVCRSIILSGEVREKPAPAQPLWPRSFSTLHTSAHWRFTLACQLHAAASRKSLTDKL